MKFLVKHKMKLPNEVLDARIELKQIPDINSGGCGIAALALYRVMQKADCADGTYFLFLHKWENEYSRNISNIKNGSYLDACHHIVLVKDNQWIDASSNTSDKLKKLYKSYMKLKVMSEKQLLDAINLCTSWSIHFQREMFIPEIADLLDINLNDVDYLD